MAYKKTNRQGKEMYNAHKYISKNLRLLRKLKGVSQEYVADMAHMSRSCYSNLESGNKLPDFLTIYTLAEFYDINLDYLLSFDISEQILSLLRVENRSLEPIYFMERYMQLSRGGKFQICVKMKNLLEKERGYNQFPWEYVDSEVL